LSPGVLGLDSGCTTQQIEEESMIFVGDDWAEDHHDVHVMDEAGRRLSARRLPEGLSGIGQLHALIAKYAEDRAARYASRRRSSPAGIYVALIDKIWNLSVVSRSLTATAVKRRNYVTRSEHMSATTDVPESARGSVRRTIIRSAVNRPISYR
jgi:hypothetical protein